jgi:hypothetical protein
MFFILNPCFVLIITMLGNLVLSLPLAMFLVALLLVLHMARYTLVGLLLALRLCDSWLHCSIHGRSTACFIVILRQE